MSALARSSYDILVPSDQDVILAQESSRTLALYMGKNDLVSVTLEDGSKLVLPNSLMRFMLDVLVQVSQGNSVTMTPIHAELTTQQAADYLNVSRPYLVDELLEKGAIPFRKVGTRRRVLFQDVLTYKQQIDQARLDTLDAMVAHDQSYDFEG